MFKSSVAFARTVRLQRNASQKTKVFTCEYPAVERGSCRAGPERFKPHWRFSANSVPCARTLPEDVIWRGRICAEALLAEYYGVRWFSNLRYRLRGYLTVDHYEVIGSEILMAGRRKAWIQSVRLDDILSWQQVFYCVGVWSILILRREGQPLQWDDSHGELLTLLQKVAPNQEMPWKAT